MYEHGQKRAEMSVKESADTLRVSRLLSQALPCSDFRLSYTGHDFLFRIQVHYNKYSNKREGLAAFPSNIEDLAGL